MKTLKLAFALTVALKISPLSSHAQWVEQDVQLKPGWNAVFLEVHPEPSSCDELFAGLPVESVWDFKRSIDSPQFIQDPSTLIPGDPGWLTWFSPAHPLAGQGDLHTLRDGRAYLVRVATNAQPFTWSVTGTPSLRRLTWHPGGLNFVGFRVGPQPPSFQQLFAGESGLVGQPVYSLSTSGHWQKLTDLATARPRTGEAYWVGCLIPSQRTATIQVDLQTREGIVFRGSAAERSIQIRNTSAGPRTVSLSLLPSAEPPNGQPPLAGPVPLEYHHADYSRTNFSWKPLTAPLEFVSLAPGQEWNVRLGARLAVATAGQPGSIHQGILQVSDDLGARWLVPITAYPAEDLPDPARLAFAAEPVANPYAGLWVGEAVLNAVSQPARPADPLTPRRAGGEFSFRLLVHVDAMGTSHLLQKAYLVRKPPVLQPDPEEPEVTQVVEPARTVVATDEGLIAGIIGDAELIGRRVSSPAFAFKDPMPLTNSVFGEGTLTATISLDYDNPLNPFRHTFHPDHNNLDERFEEKLPEGHESFGVARAIALQFTGTDPLGLNPPSWGQTEVGGTYSETITGIHRDAIKVAGTFRLVRILDTPVFNQ
jgi:hypothetical protein